MPFDWVTFILVQNIGKPRTERPVPYYRIKEKERREQNEQNQINKRRVQAYLNKGAGPFQ